MKRILLILLLLCTLCSCRGEEIPGAIPMRELFTISTYVYDEWRPEQDKSNHFSIEMISYEYSDMYKMMEGVS